MKPASPALIVRAVILTALLLPAMTSFCQQKIAGCEDIHYGLFYCYPKNSSDQYAERMDGELVHETDLRTGDTILSRIKWGKDCSFSEKYMKGNVRMPMQVKQFLQNNTIVCKITDIRKDYYTFTLYMKAVPFGLPISDDTMWFSSREHPTNKLLFVSVPNNSVLRKDHFRDTSHYAVIYLYRPGNFFASAVSYPLYMDDIETCLVANNSGYIFKVMEEGPLKIRGALFGNTISLTLPVSFGHVYYVDARVHWGATRAATRPVMQTVDEKTGKVGFEEVKFRPF